MFDSCSTEQDTYTTEYPFLGFFFLIFLEVFKWEKKRLLHAAIKQIL